MAQTRIFITFQRQNERFRFFSKWLGLFAERLEHIFKKSNYIAILCLDWRLYFWKNPKDS